MLIKKKLFKKSGRLSTLKIMDRQFEKRVFHIEYFQLAEHSLLKYLNKF